MGKAGGIQYLLKHGRAASPVTTRTQMPSTKVKKMARGGLSALSPYDLLTPEQLALLPNAYRDAIAGHPDTGGKAYFYDPGSQRYTLANIVKTATSGKAVADPLEYLKTSDRGGSGRGGEEGAPGGLGYSPATSLSAPGAISGLGKIAGALDAYGNVLGGMLPGAWAANLAAQAMNEKATIAEAIAARDALAAAVSADPSFGGGGYGSPVGEGGWGVTSPTGAGIAANPMGVDPATAQGQSVTGTDTRGDTSASEGRGAPGEGNQGGGYTGAGNDRDAVGGLYKNGKFNQRYAEGGIAALAGGGSLGSYSDGGQLLRGPGDGVSDSIPARIGHNQPARLADGEFVIPARIVSELGNGSTEAGSRKLYAMLDRIQKGRKKTMGGKGSYAKDTKADKHLPA